jgi:hypothetical protein
MHRYGVARRSPPSNRDDLILPEIAIDFRTLLLPSRQPTTDWLFVLNEPNIKPVVRLGEPSRAVLEKHLRPMIMSQLKSREPHTLAERKKHAPFCRAGFPTHMPVLAISEALGLQWRSQGAFVPGSIDPLDELEQRTSSIRGVHAP